jgi:hypothetical protein
VTICDARHVDWKAKRLRTRPQATFEHSASPVE